MVSNRIDSRMTFFVAVLLVTVLSTGLQTAVACESSLLQTFQPIRFFNASWLDGEIRVGGSSVGRVESDGTIRIRGRSVGRFESDGDIRIDGRVVGSIESDGTIRKGGSSVGKVESDGTVRKGGSSVGKIEDDGTVRKGGSSIGSARGIDKRQAAALFFFEFVEL